MKVLVTGGAGFIGSHTCKALAGAGYEPVTFDNLSTGHAHAVRFGPLEQGDIRDGARLADVIALQRPVAIIHFAASAYVGESVSEPHKYYSNNVAGTITLLEAALAAEIRTVVFSSSCATYGIPDRVPIGEEAAQSPINPYGRSKLMGEQILRDIGMARGLRLGVLRYFNAAGADPDGELEEHHDPETHLVPSALRAAYGLQDSLPIFGSDLPTPDGTCIRDFIHVSDLARGHVLALDRLLGGGDSVFANLGTGRGHSVREIVRGIEQLTRRSVPVHWQAPRPGDPPVLVADPSRAKELLGFQPRLSDLNTILRTAAQRYERLAGAKMSHLPSAAG